MTTRESSAAQGSGTISEFWINNLFYVFPPISRWKVVFYGFFLLLLFSLICLAPAFCIFIANSFVCAARAELLVSLCLPPSNTQLPPPKLWEKSQILSNSPEKKRFVLMLVCSCSTFFCFGTIMSHLRFENLFIFHPNEQQFFSRDFLSALIMHETLLYCAFAAVICAEISCCAGRHNFSPFCHVVPCYVPRILTFFCRQRFLGKGSWMTWSNNDFLSFTRPHIHTLCT